MASHETTDVPLLYSPQYVTVRGRVTTVDPYVQSRLLSEYWDSPASSHTQNRARGLGQTLRQEGGGVSIVFRHLSVTESSMTVWRHIATSQSFVSLDQFSVEKSSKLNKKRANTGFCSTFVKQFVVSVQALLLILCVCKSCVRFVRTFVLNSTPIHFGSVAWAPFWTRN